MHETKLVHLLERPPTIALVAGLVLLSYNLVPLAWGLPFLIQSVPDDGFYYLVLAENFAKSGVWTFDGQSTVSGFHLIYAYLAAGVYYLFPGIGFETIYVLSTVLNTLLIVAAVVLLIEVIKSAGWSRGVFAVLLVAISSVGLRLPGFPMESCLVVFFSAAAFYLVTPGIANIKLAAGIALLVGILGVLSRSDWGAMPFALAAGAIVHAVWAKSWPSRRIVATLAALCLGAVIGEVLVIAHTYWFTGGLLQTSAKIKSHWAHVSGYSLLPGMARVSELLGPYIVPRPVLLAASALLGAVILYYKKISFVLNQPLAIAGIFIIAGYVVLYALNGAVQYWYSANFFVAVTVLTAMAWNLLPKRFDDIKPVALVILLAGAAIQVRSPPWNWAPAMMQGGEYLKTNQDIKPVGSWNAGIIRYFAERPVINLDGLVNDDVAEYVTTGKLSRYVDSQQINFVLDFAGMMSPQAGARGGYEDGAFLNCVEKKKVIRPDLKFLDNSMTLFSVDMTCLGEQSAR